MVYAAVLAGAGVAAIPSFICANDIRAGRLERILQDWVVDRKDIRIVYPSNRHLSPRVRLFVDALVMEFSTQVARIDEMGGVQRSRRPARGGDRPDGVSGDTASSRRRG
jgi:hypothetical protein